MRSRPDTENPTPGRVGEWEGWSFFSVYANFYFDHMRVPDFFFHRLLDFSKNVKGSRLHIALFIIIII